MKGVHQKHALMYHAFHAASGKTIDEMKEALQCENVQEFACFYNSRLDDTFGYLERFLNIFEDVVMRPVNSDWISKLSTSSGVSVDSFVRYWRSKKVTRREKMNSVVSDASKRAKGINLKRREPSLSIGEPASVSASQEMIEEMIPQQSPVRSYEVVKEPKEPKEPEMIDMFPREVVKEPKEKPMKERKKERDDRKGLSLFAGLSEIHYVLTEQYDLSDQHPLWAQQTLDKIQEIINKSKE